MNPEIETESALPISVPAGAPAWVTPKLLEDTIQSWQPYSVELLTASDALEILISAAHLFDVLEKMEQTDDETFSGAG